MAWARPPGAPQIPSCPLEALEPRLNEYKPFYREYGMQYGAGIACAVGPLLSNRYKKLPWYFGIWRCVVFGIAGYYSGLYLKHLAEEYADEKDAVLRKYIQLHPDDFPPYKKVLYKDVIYPWDPVR